ncbi:MAG TPA: tetratricopeptide repeat protein [Chlorobaculum parvum]|uniref:Tetratricopeptide repeat protein n=1 Tax=Chlorobaculum parvum TaxID=274539 RepID=A0A7C5DEW0_9CHLB|nr:tetratricopeptide repeat protein [Chlorobaculum parvum]
MKHRAISLVLAVVSTIILSATCAAQSAAEYYNQALSEHQAGELQQAVRLYTKAIKKDDRMIMAYQMRGAAWQQMRQLQQAFDDYTILIEQDEPYFRAVGYFNRGIVNDIAGRHTEAIDDFTGAVKIDWKMGAAYFHRAVARLKSRDSTGAFKDLHQAARLGDTDAKQWLDLLSPGWREQKK